MNFLSYMADIFQEEHPFIKFYIYVSQNLFSLFLWFNHRLLIYKISEKVSKKLSDFLPIDLLFHRGDCNFTWSGTMLVNLQKCFEIILFHAKVNLCFSENICMIHFWEVGQ